MKTRPVERGKEIGASRNASPPAPEDDLANRSRSKDAMNEKNFETCPSVRIPSLQKDKGKEEKNPGGAKMGGGEKLQTPGDKTSPHGSSPRRGT